MRIRAALVLALLAVALVSEGGEPAGGGISGVSTNMAARVQCAAQTKSGTRCKRRAANGTRYCRQHSAAAAAKTTPKSCRALDDGGKSCEAQPVAGRYYCEKHLR